MAESLAESLTDSLTEIKNYVVELSLLLLAWEEAAKRTLMLVTELSREEGRNHGP